MTLMIRRIAWTYPAIVVLAVFFWGSLSLKLDSIIGERYYLYAGVFILFAMFIQLIIFTVSENSQLLLKHLGNLIGFGSVVVFVIHVSLALLLIMRT